MDRDTARAIRSVTESIIQIGWCVRIASIRAAMPHGRERREAIADDSETMIAAMGQACDSYWSAAGSLMPGAR